MKPGFNPTKAREQQGPAALVPKLPKPGFDPRNARKPR